MTAEEELRLRPTASRPEPRVAARLACAVAPAAAYLLLLGLSWRRTAGPVVDFGREAYTAWRLSQGAVLYRDVASLFGPLAAYVDAGAFALFGPSLGVLFGLNALLVAATTALVYVYVLRISRHPTASLAALTFLAVFALTCTGGPNYNFLSPYSEAAVWGVAAGMCALVCLERWLAGAGSAGAARAWPFAAGAAAGLTVLTKPEITVATLGASALALALGPGPSTENGAGGIRKGAARRGSMERGHRRRGAAWFAAGMALPLAVTLGAFGAAGSPSLGLEAVTAAFRPLLRHDPLAMEFYRHWAGLDAPAERTVDVLAAGATVALAVGAMAAADRLLVARSSGWGRRTGRILALATLAAAVGAAAAAGFPVAEVLPRAMPLLLLAALVWCGREIRRAAASAETGTAGGTADRVEGPGRRARRPDPRALAVWLVFSLLMLLKSGLFPRFHHYGFYLSAPGGVGLVVVLIELLPRWLGRRAGTPVLVRLTGVALVLVTVLGHALVSAGRLRARHEPIGSGADLLWGRGSVPGAVRRTLRRLEELAPGDATLAVIPEGASLNYWSRRVNPTPHVSFMPPELAFHGTGRMLGALEAHPPDIVVLWARPLTDYGVDRWGEPGAPGSEIADWVRRHYGRVERIPVPGRGFAFEILRRVTPPADGAAPPSPGSRAPARSAPGRPPGPGGPAPAGGPAGP